ncbi:MAG: malate dehydrogenase [Euryarchaeota archaeon]|nr:malate dehydrogenase [Euryarchaeota archaeon]
MVKKIGFVGSGAIGATSAYATLSLVNVDEIVMYDIFKGPAEGHAMDLSTSAIAFGKRTRVRGTDDFSELAGADLLVVSAGFPRKPGMTRLDLLEKNVQVLRDVATKTKEHCPDAIFLLVSNPVDVLLSVCQDILDFPRERIFGMSSLHDSVRLNDLLTDAGITDSQAVILGEHGETMFPVPSLSTGTGIDGVDWDDLETRTRGRAMEIIERKGATSWAPGACVARMVRAVVDDTHEEIPACCLLEGEYGYKDVSIGVPAVFGRKGMLEIKEYDLSDDEKTKMKKTVETVRQKIEEARELKTQATA